MTAPLRVAVVGVGSMGWHHARVYSELRDVELVGVVDESSARAAECAAAFGCEVLRGTDEVIERCAAASVAVPSSRHAHVAVPLLEAGVHCLVEKPIAPTLAGLDAIEQAASRSGAAVLVGHIERFNPAIEHLPRVLREEGAVLAFDVRRLSGSSARITDVDVILDLMVHDLDIVRWLAASEPVSVAADGVCVEGSSSWDHVQVLIRFASGSVASLAASRVSQERRRELRVLTALSSVVVDHADQSLHVHRQAAIREREQGYTIDAQVERVLVRTAEPLLQELAHFRDICLGTAPARFDLADVRATMELTWAAQAALERVDR